MPTSANSSSQSWFVRLAWFVVLWTLGVAGMSLAAVMLRTIIRAAGLM